MSEIKDLFDQLKERFSNPFLFSFIILIIFFNWEIFVSLLWYDPDQISKEGFNSIYDFIRKKSNQNLRIFDSFHYALGYAVGYPFLRMLIKVVHSAIDTTTNSLVIFVTKGGKVSIEKYLEVKKELEKRKKDLEIIIQSESKVKLELDLVSNDYQNISNQLAQVTQSLIKSDEKLIKFTDISILDGFWNISIGLHQNSTELSKHRVRIQNNVIFYIDIAGSLIRSYEILHFFNNINGGNEICLIVEKSENSDTPIFGDYSYLAVKPSLIYNNVFSGIFKTNLSNVKYFIQLNKSENIF